MTDIEDRSRRNNVRLVGLPEGAEGSDVAGFLRVNLSKWIPSLKGRDNIEIDRAHRMYDGRKNSDRPRTLIFRVLRWHDRSEILKGARQVYQVKCTQALVQPQPPGEKALFRFWGRWRWYCGILFIFIRYNCLFAGKTNPPFFSFFSGGD